MLGGDDMVDYCITILPKRSGLFTGALVFKTTDMDYRYLDPIAMSLLCALS